MSKARDLANAGTALTTVSPTELGYLDGVTSAVQTQINSKIGQSTAINPTIVDAKGDLIAATAADTVARLAVGTDGQILTADSTASTGVKWATPASGTGNLAQIATGSLTGSSVTISGLSSYSELYLHLNTVNLSTNADVSMRLNGNTGSNYVLTGGQFTSAAEWTSSAYTGTSIPITLGIALDSGYAGRNNFWFNFTDTKTTGFTRILEGGGVYGQGGGTTSMITLGVTYAVSEALSSISVYPSSGTFDGGTYTIWGA